MSNQRETLVKKASARYDKACLALEKAADKEVAAFLNLKEVIKIARNEELDIYRPSGFQGIYYFGIWKGQR